MSRRAFGTKSQPGRPITPATLESGARGGVPRVEAWSAEGGTPDGRTGDRRSRFGRPTGEANAATRSTV